MKYLFIVSVCLIISFYEAKAHQSFIEVNLPEKVQEDIIFYTYFEPFYQLKDTLFQFKAENKQSFSFSVDIQSTICLYSAYGPYECFFFVEPGASYEVNFPEILKFEESWKNNPYFQRFGVQTQTKRIGNYSPVKTEVELNQAIHDYLTEYNTFSDNQLLSYYHTEYNQQKLDSFLLSNTKVIKVSDQEYYDAFVLYNEGVLSFTAKKYPTEVLIDLYFKNKKTLFNIPSYNQLFKLCFSNYYDYLQQKDKFSKIFDEFTMNSYSSVKEYLTQDELMKNDIIFQYILLHEIYNAYYSGNYNKKRMISFADSVYAASRIPEIKTTAIYLLKKFTHLQPGYEAVDFTLADLSSDTINLSSFEGKYLLLGFCQLENINCLKEFEYLKYLHSKHQQYLKIITIIADSSHENVIEYVERNNIDWPVVGLGKDEQIFADYEVKSFPLFFLIGRDGKLILSPAPNPSQGFEQQLFRIMKSRADI
jgi:peroxiredoxin